MNMLVSNGKKLLNSKINANYRTCRLTIYHNASLHKRDVNTCDRNKFNI